MTAIARDTYMTFQVIDDRGVNLTNEIPIVEFNLEWERNTIAELANMAPITQMRTGRLHTAFREDGTVLDQLEAVADRHERNVRNRRNPYVRRTRISLVANLDDGNFVQYHNANLTSYENDHENDHDHTDALIYAAWGFGEILATTTAPVELRKSRPIPTQKLDWLKLGF